MKVHSSHMIVRHMGSFWISGSLADVLRTNQSLADVLRLSSGVKSTGSPQGQTPEGLVKVVTFGCVSVRERRQVYFQY